jgi:hypothetical protein
MIINRNIFIKSHFWHGIGHKVHVQIYLRNT